MGLTYVYNHGHTCGSNPRTRQTATTDYYCGLLPNGTNAREEVDMRLT